MPYAQAPVDQPSVLVTPTPVKNRGKEPALPAQRAPAPASGGLREIPAPPPRPALAEAAAVLHRVTAAEPRLRLGTAEAQALAPLAAPWLERGLGPRDLSFALLGDRRGAEPTPPG